MKPPTLEQIIEYVKAKNLMVNAETFYEHYTCDEDNLWKDKNGKPIKSWKQKAQTWHSFEQKQGKPHRCCQRPFGSCRNPGIYYAGTDGDGHSLFWCHYHKPKFKPVLPKDITENVLKTVPKIDVVLDDDVYVSKDYDKHQFIKKDCEIRDKLPKI